MLPSGVTAPATSKVAVTTLAASIVSVHGPVPVHAPLQRVSMAPVLAVAVKVTTVPTANVSLQPAPQSMPAGLLVTLPLPLPIVATVNVWARSHRPILVAGL